MLVGSRHPYSQQISNPFSNILVSTNQAEVRDSLVSFLPFVIIVYLGGKNKLNKFGIQSENNNQMHKNKNNISITS